MNNLGDKLEKAGFERPKTNYNAQNRQSYGKNQQSGNRNQNGNRQGYENNNDFTDLTIDFKNGYDPVKEGEKLVKKMVEKREKNFTTSQLRKIHSYASIVNNKIQMEESKGNSSSYKISEALQSDVQYIKLKLIYQMGREKSIKKWFGSEGTEGIKGIGLEKIIADIGDSKEKFDKFYRLLESIIAYKKYMIYER